MKQDFFHQNWTDENGNPAGGVASGRGFTISWQNGPLGRIGTDERIEPNGAFVEEVLEAVKERFKFYNSANGGKFKCFENTRSIELLEEIGRLQETRTRRRIEDKTEGTHEGS